MPPLQWTWIRRSQKRGGKVGKEKRMPRVYAPYPGNTGRGGLTHAAVAELVRTSPQWRDVLLHVARGRVRMLGTMRETGLLGVCGEG